MKKFSLLILIALASMYSFAQNASLVIESERHEHFWVYINGRQQNRNPDPSIQVSGLYADWDYNVRIVMDNKRRSEMTTVMRLHPGNNNYLLNCNPRSGQISISSIGHQPPQHGDHGNNPPYPPQGQFPLQGPPQGNYPPQGQFPPNGQYPPQGDFPPQGHPDHHHHEHTVVQPPAPEPVIVPCSDADFIEAKRTIENATFEETKLTIAKQIVASEFMTARQLAEIANLFDFENTKLEFLKFAYQYCFDQNKYYTVNNVFKFSSSVDELNKYINR